jgi:hypothetical protein
MHSLRQIPLVAILPVDSASGRRCRSASCCLKSSFPPRGVAFSPHSTRCSTSLRNESHCQATTFGCRPTAALKRHSACLSHGTMAQGQNNTSHWALVLIAGAFAVAGFLTVTGWSKLPEGNADQWRRTAAGWERATQWPTAIGLRRVSTALQASSAKAPTPARYDTHPAVLALLQIVGTLTALRMFASPAPQSFRGWLAMLTQSFRASAFGS